jgi:hypothetical protein
MPTSDSDPGTGTLALTGVWLHDPDDAEGTATGFPYGAAAREHSYDTAGQGTLYAGRTYPVTDYGEHEEETLTVSIAVPHGSGYAADLATLASFARAKRTVWARDNRGRSLPATINSFKIQDQKWGATVAITLTRVDYPVTEVAA